MSHDPHLGFVIAAYALGLVIVFGDGCDDPGGLPEFEAGSCVFCRAEEEPRPGSTDGRAPEFESAAGSGKLDLDGVDHATAWC